MQYTQNNRNAEDLGKLKVRDMKKLDKNAKDRLFTAVLMLKEISVKKTSNGNDFFRFVFGDNSGILNPFRCFDSSPVFETLRNAKPGDAFEVRAAVDFWVKNDSSTEFSPVLQSLRLLKGAELAAAGGDLEELSPRDPVEMRNGLNDVISQISNPVLRKTVNAVLERLGEGFYSASAAVKMHHAYGRGLLEHTLATAETVKALLGVYTFVDRDLALSGAVLHDVGKVAEYGERASASPTRAGILHGHVVLGYRLVCEEAQKCGLEPRLLERLGHIILSHQGKREWGAAVEASTAEALLVSLADNVNAKMAAAQYAALHGGGEEFTRAEALDSKNLLVESVHPGGE